MDRSDRRIEFQDTDLVDVRKILGEDGLLDSAEVARHRWCVCEIDDKALFNEDARRLASAFRAENSDCFYVVHVCDLLRSEDPVVAYRFSATQEEIEAFQGSTWFEINLDDCLLFNLPFTCAVLRPGSVDATMFAGGAAFIAKMEHG
jgi:hypothetical protein